MNPKQILIGLAILCFAIAALDFYPTRLIAAGLFLISLSMLIG